MSKRSRQRIANERIVSSDYSDETEEENSERSKDVQTSIDTETSNYQTSSNSQTSNVKSSSNVKTSINEVNQVNVTDKIKTYLKLLEVKFQQYIVKPINTQMKNNNPLIYLLAYHTYIYFMIAYYLGGIFSYLPFFIYFVIFPTIEPWFGEDPREGKRNSINTNSQVNSNSPVNSNSSVNSNSQVNLDSQISIDDSTVKINNETSVSMLSDIEQGKYNDLFKIVTYIWIPLHIAVLNLAMSFSQDCTLLEALGMALSTGTLTGAIGLNIAHLYIHSSSPLEDNLSKFLLTITGNRMFYIYHLHGHHKLVGKPEDVFTAKRGESLYKFYMRYRRTFIHKCLDFRFQKNKIDHEIDSFVIDTPWIMGVICILISLIYGFIPLCVFFVQCLVAEFLLVLTNYVQHYGITRVNRKVSFKDSWDSNSLFSSIMLFSLQRHSDHHVNPSKDYQDLIYKSAGYIHSNGHFSACFLALIPNIWFKYAHEVIELSTRFDNEENKSD